MKDILDWKSKRVVNIFDEVNLWSAPFAKLMMENIPMKKGMTIVDIGFGTGFPLIELSQRFGQSSKIYGIDIWQEAIKRTKEKIEVLELENIEIIEESASEIKLANNTIDLVTSNLGVNNFEDREKVYSEIYRILRDGGVLSITTNPIGTFEQLFDLFQIIMKEMKLENSIDKLTTYVNNRKTENQIIEEIESHKLGYVKSINEKTKVRFVDPLSLLNHSLIRAGFKTGWDELIEEKDRKYFYAELLSKIERVILKNGEFQIDIPLLYLEFKK